MMTDMTRVRVGTSGYNYAEWKGSFYPKTLSAARMLTYYAGRFSTVEVNYTFRRMPTAKVVAGWTAAAPPSFTFVLKAPQRITHFARLGNIAEPLGLFADVARTLGDRLGPLLFQLPPTFKKDTGRLAETLARVPRDLRCVFEFRHPTWFADDVYEVLRAGKAALCIADNEEGATPALATTDFGYLRLRAVKYRNVDLARWVTTIREVGRGWRDAFVFFKHEESASGPALARRFERLLARTLTT